jgi:uncharacterized Rossmann fold enzyme
VFVNNHPDYELYEVFNDSDFVNYIKVKRLEWAKYLMQMDDNRTLKEDITN